MRREAVLSSRIDDTRTSVDELLRDEVESNNERAHDEGIRAVHNYVAALEHGIHRLSKLPFTLRLVREIHAQLMEGAKGGSVTPGEFRKSQNWIGPPGSTLSTAFYVPPPPAEMTVALGTWEQFVRVRESTPDLVQCALMHEQFEAIQPFLNGNGRVGRLLITLFLIERGRLSLPLLYLSDYVERHRQCYYELLRRVRTNGDWTGWLLFFLSGIAETAREAVGRAGRLMGLHGEFSARLTGIPRAVALLDKLFVNPYITVARAAKLLQISNPTARKAVATLQKSGILEEVTGRTWGRLYLARPILKIIED